MKSMRLTVARTNGEEALNILSEQAPVGVCIIQDGKFCYFNSNFPIAIGYTADELIGKDPLELIVPEDREMVKENEIRMLKGELLSPYQFRVIHKDGSIRWVMEAVRSVQYHGRRAVLGNYMEVTERRQMEEALKESEERYKELANSITDIFFAMDEHLKYTYWNKTSEILTGIRAEDAIGKSLREIFPDTPGMRKAEKVYRDVLRTGQSQTFVNDFNIDGKHYTFEISAYPSQGGISVFAKDVTEHKQAEEMLRRSEEKYRTILEEIGDGYFETDLAGNLTFVNDALGRLLGYSREEIIGMNFKAFRSEEEANAAFKAYNRVYKTGEPLHNLLTEIICKDGRHAFAETSAFPIRNDNGQIIGFRGIRRDITDRKRAEEKLRESEQKYRLLFETSLDSIVQLDREGRHLAANPAAAKSLGVPLEELIGKTLLEVVPAEVARLRLGNVRKVLDEWTPQIFEDERSGRCFHHIVIPTKTSEQKEAVQVITRDITERKQAEEALRRSEERYRTILEKMEEGYYEVDMAGNFTFVSDAICHMLGYSRDELIGMSYKIYTPKEDAKAIFQAYNRVYQTGEPLKWFPMVDVTKDGTRMLVEDSVLPMRNDKGEIIGFRGLSRDVTQRKRVEEALRRSEERYRTMLAEMEDGYFEVDLAGNLTFANDAVCRDLKYSREELIGKKMNYKDYTVEQDIESVFRVFNEVYRTGVPNKGFPWKTIRKDGSHGFAETSVSPLRNDKGEIIGFRGVGRDVTEREQTQDKLRHSEKNYKTLFNSSVIGTFVLDAETMKIMMANQAAAKIFEFSSVEEGIGLNPVDFISPEDKKRGLEIIVKEMFEEDLRQPNEFRAITRNGREIWISAMGAKIMHEGRSAGLVSFTDITEQKKQNERLMRTDRLASLGELASGTAHELNNPLTSIIGFSQLLMEKEVPDDIHDDLKLIYSEAQRAVNITKNLLAFARKYASVKQRNQINSIIEDVLELRAYEHKANSIEVVRHLAPRLPEIMVDYFQMQQVFMNIIINAEYFMTKAHNQGTLTITTKTQNDTVMISFADDGPGISPEDLRRIFDPFFTTKEAGKGTGLGLSICHGIVTEHGGQIYARSQLGKGATFFVELPIEGRDHIEGMLKIG